MSSFLVLVVFIGSTYGLLLCIHDLLTVFGWLVEDHDDEGATDRDAA